MAGASWGDIVLGLALAAAVASAVAWILRGAGIPGGRPAAAVVGGIIAGVLLGPAVLGRAAPGLHERLYLGGASERRFLEAVLARQSADRVAQRAAAPSTEAANEMRARHAAERKPLEAALGAAEADHRSALAGGAACVLAVGAGTGMWARRRARPVRWAAVPIGAAAALGAEVLAMTVLARWAFGLPWPLVLGLAAAGACGSAFAAVPMRWVPRAGRSGLARATGTLLFLGACAAVAFATWPRYSLAPLAPAAGLIMGLMIQRPIPATVRERGPLRALLTGLVIPAVVAVAALHIEWSRFAGDAWAWPLVVAVAVLSGNAAVLGTWAGCRLGGARVKVTDLVDWHAAGSGPTQACVGVLLLAGGALAPATAMGSAALAGLLLSAAVGEVTLGWMGRTLREAERQAEAP